MNKIPTIVVNVPLRYDCIDGSLCERLTLVNFPRHMNSDTSDISPREKRVDDDVAERTHLTFETVD